MRILCLSALLVLLPGPVSADDQAGSSPVSSSGKKLATSMPGIPAQSLTKVVSAPKAPPRQVKEATGSEMGRSMARKPALGTPAVPATDLEKITADASRAAERMAKNNSFGVPAQFLAWTIASFRQWQSPRVTPVVNPGFRGDDFGMPDYKPQYPEGRF